ncbi:NMD3-domain-containing protein [Nadsonia fulvescens var. elongata DSM 6958]|uniref:60S ribosomal export protein NMD3 n=1 Tax=Nadsonia fulvescens var. elongata DSM 6958 TaxID=857566 RepID=A0A1E3PUE0_9ASCO|nr:NMD3-domain-containing protein [Nadsonia fulvescens var. elongata DSM 6958]
MNFDSLDLQHLGSQQIGTYTPVHTPTTILCCNCGDTMLARPGGVAICEVCIRDTADIISDIPRHGVLSFCKNCGRLNVPPNQWIRAPPESRELMAQILKRLKGLHRLRLMDAVFLWTEPHSRRVKVKITVQGEAKEFGNTMIQQSFQVEMVEHGGQCPDCAKSFTANTWRATVQIRQKVVHKKTFFFLEQLILKNHMHKNTVSIQESKEGLDFFFNHKQHAITMVDFLSNAVPCRTKRSEELISMDTHTSVRSYKFTFSVEIVPICKDDIVVLPSRLAKSIGSTSRIFICHKIGSSIRLIDPRTLQTIEIPAQLYWRNPFDSLSSAKNLVEYMVLDIEPVFDIKGHGHGNGTAVAAGRYALADVTVMRASELGSGDAEEHFVRTHLGGILKTGDIVLGYPLSVLNLNNTEFDQLKPESIPDIVLVKKTYPDKKKNRGRKFKLKRMAVEYNNLDAPGGDEKTKKVKKGKGASTGLMPNADDYEEFLNELEEDPELRSEINLYTADIKGNPAGSQDDNQTETTQEENDYESDVEIKLNELKLEDSEDEYIPQPEDSAEEY